MKNALLLVLFPLLLCAEQFDIQEILDRVGNNCSLKIYPEKYCTNDADKEFPTGYAIKVENESPLKKYSLVLLNLNGVPVVCSGKVEIDEKSKLLTEEGQTHCIIPCNMGPGEYLNIILVSHDRNEIAITRLSSNPLEISRNGYTINLSLIDPTAKTFMLIAKGFDPNEEVSLLSRSANEKLKNKFKVESNGEFIMNISPGVIGVKGAVATLEFTGKKGTISIDYPWGEEWFKAPKK